MMRFSISASRKSGRERKLKSGSVMALTFASAEPAADSFVSTSYETSRVRGVRKSDLLVAERVDRIEVRRFARRVEAEEHADRRRDAERQGDRVDRHDDRPTGGAAHERRDSNAETDTHQTADDRQRHCLEQELQQDV